jgi:DNA-directed RNA polymerase subunit RPC12/RpoP
MTALTALPRALVRAGLAQEPKERRKHYRQFKCHQCGSKMIQIPETNTMACERCGQYFIFNNSK